MAIYLSQAVLRLKYNQTRFPFWRFLRLRNLTWDFFFGGGGGRGVIFGPRIFWGFDFGPNYFGNPCHLKFRVPPWGTAKARHLYCSCKLYCLVKFRWPWARWVHDNQHCFCNLCFWILFFVLFLFFRLPKTLQILVPFKKQQISFKHFFLDLR